MTTYFLDTSTIVKRYLAEIGTSWVRQLSDPASGNTIMISEISLVEVAAALAARHRAQGGLSRQARDSALALFTSHFATQYDVVSINRAIVHRAVALTQQHRLRGYDALQLATALTANATLTAAGQPGLVFVAADGDLITAAQAEGLPTDNPNHYP